MSRAKFFAGMVAYNLAFATHLAFLYAFINPKTYNEWQQLLRAFGGEPFPGTDGLLWTLRFWWIYPLIGTAVFVYGLIIRKRILLSLLFMTAVAVIFAVYFEGPLALLGSIV